MSQMANINIFDLFEYFMKLTSPIILYHIASNIKIRNNEFIVVLASLLILNVILFIIQYYFLPEMTLLIDSFGNMNWAVLSDNSIYTKRVAGFLGNANVAATFTLVLIGLILLLSYKNDVKVITPILLILALIVIVLFTKSRHSLIMYMFTIYYFSKNNIISKSLVLFTSVFCISYYLVLLNDLDILKYFFRIDIFQDIYRVVSIREDINITVIKSWLGSSLIFFGGGFSREASILNFLQSYYYYSESSYLKILIESGIVGIVLYIILFIHWYKINNTNVNRKVIIFIYGIMIISSIFETVFLQKTMVYFMVIIFGLLSNNTMAGFK